MRIGSTPKAVERGAERLADPERTGHVPPTLARTKFSADWVDTADGKPTRVEGSVDEETAYHIDNTAQQQHEEVTNKLFEVPCKFEPEHRSLLQAAHVNFTCGAVQTITC